METLFLEKILGCKPCCFPKEREKRERERERDGELDVGFSCLEEAATSGRRPQVKQKCSPGSHPRLWVLGVIRVQAWEF